MNTAKCNANTAIKIVLDQLMYNLDKVRSDSLDITSESRESFIRNGRWHAREKARVSFLKLMGHTDG